MGNSPRLVKDDFLIQNKINELYSVALDYLIVPDQIKTESFMKGYKNEKCTIDDDKEECEKGITYKKNATNLIKTKTGELRQQLVNNTLEYFGHDTTRKIDSSDDFINIDTGKIILEQELDHLIADIYHLNSKFKHAKKKSINKSKKKSNVKSINKLKKKSKAKRGL